MSTVKLSRRGADSKWISEAEADGRRAQSIRDRRQRGRRNQPDADVTLLAAEPYPLYNRVALPIFLKGKVQEKNVMMRTPEIHEQRGVKLHLETWVKAVCLEERTVVTDTGREYPFDCLLIATGGTPRELEVPGSHLHGVYQFQTLDDTKAL